MLMVISAVATLGVMGAVLAVVFSLTDFNEVKDRSRLGQKLKTDSKRAFVACAATDASYRLFKLAGVYDCRTAFIPYGGDRACRVTCLGYGSCIEICPNNALAPGATGKPLVSEACDGCGLCVLACPTGAMILIEASAAPPKACQSKASLEERRSYGSPACLEPVKFLKINDNALQNGDYRLDYGDKTEATVDND